MICEGRAARHRQHKNELMSLAWHTAALMRTDPRKKLPKLERLLTKEPRKKAMGWEEQLAIAMSLNAQINAGKVDG